jgi:hypothetical protein
MNGCERGFLVITLWPTFGAVQSIVLHLDPLLKVFVVLSYPLHMH